MSRKQAERVACTEAQPLLLTVPHTKQGDIQDTQLLLLTIPQVMRCMGLGRNKVYDLIHKEGLPVMRFGRAVRVSYTALQRWLEQRERMGV